MHDGAVQNLEPARAIRFTDDNLGDVVGARIGDDIIRYTPCSARYRDRLATEVHRKTKRVGDPIAFLVAELRAAAGFNVDRGPRRMQPVGQALRGTHQSGGARVLTDADQEAFARSPGPRDRFGLHLREQLLVHALGGPAQRKLAQGGQIGWREEVFQSPLGLLRDVDLPFLQPLNEIRRCQIDEFYGLGAIEDFVGHRFPDADARNLRYPVVEALDVLDIDRCIDVDATVQNFFDIEVTLGMPATRSIRMRKLVHQRDLRPARDDRVQIHLVEQTTFVVDPFARDGLQAYEKRLGLLAAVRLDHADDDIVAVSLPRAGGLQHGVSLAHAGSGSHEDAQLPDAALFALRCFQQSFRRGPCGIALIRHPWSNNWVELRPTPYLAESRARFRARTFTRGSPSRPSHRDWVCSWTSRSTRSSGIFRSLETRGT